MCVSLRYVIAALILLGAVTGCRHKKEIEKTQANTPIIDSTNPKCRLDFKTAKALSRYARDNEFKFTWLFAKANVESNIDQKENNFDIRISARKDSAMLVTIQYVLGLQVAKLLITKDTVIFVNYLDKTYFKGDFGFINELLNADLDFELLQAVLFGNTADFQDDDARMKPVADRINCHYLLSTARKRRLRKMQQGTLEVKDALQVMTLNPENFKILKNEFSDPVNNRRFIATYSNFVVKDSVFAPYHVDIDILAEKNASVKIDYVRIEKNSPQKLSLNIPGKYDRVTLQKK